MPNGSTVITETPTKEFTFDMVHGMISSIRAFFKQELLESVDYVRSKCGLIEEFIIAKVDEWIQDDDFDMVDFIQKLHTIPRAVPQCTGCRATDPSPITDDKFYLFILYSLLLYNIEFKPEFLTNFNMRNFALLYYYMISMRKKARVQQCPLGYPRDKMTSYVSYCVGTLNFLSKEDRNMINTIICPQA